MEMRPPVKRVPDFYVVYRIAKIPTPYIVITISIYHTLVLTSLTASLLERSCIYGGK
jgi:hypothetical protein